MLQVSIREHTWITQYMPKLYHAFEPAGCSVKKIKIYLQYLAPNAVHASGRMANTAQNFAVSSVVHAYQPANRTTESGTLIPP